MNPFDVVDAKFLVLQNDSRQYSIWPQHIASPPGWSVVFGPADRAAALEYVERTWVDLRPLIHANDQ